MDTTTTAFRLAHASGGGWSEMTEACLLQLGHLPDDTNLGFVYVTDSLDDELPQITARLKERTGIADWVGTIGFGVCVTGQEYFDRPAMAVLVGAMPAGSFRVLPSVAKPGEALPDAVRAWVAEKHPMLGVVHADPRNGHVPAIVDSLSDDTECFLVGGLTASRGRQTQLAGEPCEGGVSGVLFAADVRVATGLTQGCSPIGPIHEVTKSRDQVVMELDGKPAFEVFRSEIGEILARNLSRVGGYIHVALPIAGSDKADYLVRNLMGIDPQNGWIAVGDRLKVGDKLMFVRRDGAAAMADLERMVADVKKRADVAPRAALYFSCVARGPNLFGRNSEELKAVQAAVGDVPLVGFYANGEICNNRLYGYTGVLTLIM
ncbi:MAG: FIST N-terminal domain-containing protein [Rhodospirillales bacterium]